MPTPEEITDPLLSTYVRVPPVGPGVCDLCHSQPSSGYVRCYSCTLTTQQVSRPVELVTPRTRPAGAHRGMGLGPRDVTP